MSATLSNEYTEVEAASVLKVVLDTNIFVSSIFWEKGAPHKVVEYALDKKIRVFTSVEILRELEKVLRRDFEEPDDLIHRQVSLIFEYADVIMSTIKVDVVKKDPDDNKIIACALSCDADYIVTGDNHLLDIEEYKRIKIVTPRKFVEIMEKSKS